MNIFDLQMIEKQLERLQNYEEEKLREIENEDHFGAFLEDRKISLYEAAKALINAFDEDSKRKENLVATHDALECIRDELERGK